MQIFQFNKIIALIILLSSFSLAFGMGNKITITSDKPSYHCGFDVKPGFYACEEVKLTIHSNKFIKNVHLEMPYDYKNGKIDYVINKQNGKIFKSHKKFITNKLFKKQVTLDDFNLYPGDTVITLTPIAHGNFKWDAVLVNSNENQLAILDPWFYTNFKYKTNFNLTSSSSTLTDFQVMLVLNDSNINYSHTNDDGSDLRFTWLNETSGEEQEVSYWIDNQSEAGWNESGNSYIWIKAPKIDTDGEQFYYYYGNTSAVNASTNGTATFDFFDDFDNGTTLDNSKWDESGTVNVSDGSVYIDPASYIKQLDTINFTNKILDYKLKSGLGADYYFSVGYDGDGNSYFENKEPIYQMNWENGGTDGIFTRYVDTSGNINQTSLYTPYPTDETHNYNLLLGENHLKGYMDGTLIADASTVNPNPDNLHITFLRHSANTGGNGVYLYYILLRSYSTDTITQTFGEEVLRNIDIIKPESNSNIFSQNVNLTFKVPYLSNYTIYIDGITNKTVNITTTTWTEYFNLTAGNHTFYIEAENDTSLNNSINFTAKDFLITNVDFNSTTYELMQNTINATIKHLSTIGISNSTLNYDGTNYTPTEVTEDSETSYLITTVLTPFITNGTSKTVEFNLTTNSNNSKTEEYSNNQTIQIGYYISNATVDPTIIIEGGGLTNNITVTKKTNYAIIKIYSNLSGNEQEATYTNLNGEEYYYSNTQHAPAVTNETNYTITYYMNITYGGTTVTRTTTITNNITVKPINIGICDATRTKIIMNFTAWDEMNLTKQFTTDLIWETKIDAIAENGNISKTIGIKETTTEHHICIEPNTSYELNTSTWVSYNQTNSYVRRSYFTLNKLFTNDSTQENKKIFLLNYSLASIVNFVVKDSFDNAQENRIIKFYKFDPQNSDYIELFNLITDKDGKAVGYIKAYDQWYKLVIINEQNEITVSIPSTQFSADTYPIIETLEEFGQYQGISVMPSWNNVSKIFSATISSAISHDFKLEVQQLGIFANTTYCEETGTGDSLVLYCDLSNSSINEFKWVVSYKTQKINGEEYYYSLKEGYITSAEEATYGETGLILTILLLIISGTIYVRSGMKGIVIILTLIGLTISKVMGLFPVKSETIIGIWAVGLILIYLLRGDN